MTIVKCQACGVEKDTDVLDFYPYDDGITTDEPIAPLLKLDCQGYEFCDPFKVVTVCHGCFHKLQPDMWISREGWESLAPVVPFVDLPDCENS